MRTNFQDAKGGGTPRSNCTLDSTFPQHAKRAKQLEEAKQRDDAKAKQAKEMKAKDKADKDAAAKKQRSVSFSLAISLICIVYIRYMYRL